MLGVVADKVQEALILQQQSREYKANFSFRRFGIASPAAMNTRLSAADRTNIVKAHHAKTIGETFRRLAQPVPIFEGDDDPNNNNNHFDFLLNVDKNNNNNNNDKDQHSRSEKTTAVLPRADNFLTRVLHARRIQHCVQLSGALSGFDSYYNTKTEPDQFLIDAMSEIALNNKNDNMVNFEDNNVEFGWFLFFMRFIKTAPALSLKFRCRAQKRAELEQMYRNMMRIKNKNNDNNNQRQGEGENQEKKDELVNDDDDGSGNSVNGGGMGGGSAGITVPTVSYEFKQILGFMAVVACITLTALTSILGLLFPLLFAFNYFSTMQLMQQVCFYPTMFCLLGAIFSIPAAVRYQLTCMVFRGFLGGDADSVGLIVDSFFSVPITTVRAVAAPKSSIIPTDCFDKHVLEFLDPKLCGLYGLYGERFKAVENMIGKIIKEQEEEEEKNKKNN